MNTPDERTSLTSTDFRERVMAAISGLPAPTPTRSFVASIRARALRDAIASLSVAWHLGTVRSWHIAPRVRVRSFALVLAVASGLTTGSLAAAAAVHSVVPQRDDRNPVAAPSGSSVDEGPAGNGLTNGERPQRSQEPTASESPPPSEAPVSTTDHRPAATDDRQDTTTDDGTGAADEQRGSGDGSRAGDEDATDRSDDAHTGSDSGDQPAATDDHEGADGPGETDGPGDLPTGDGGSSGDAGGDTPDSTSEPDSNGDGSGG